MVVVVTIDKQIGNVVAGPDIVSRGFVYVRESEELIKEAEAEVGEVISQCIADGVTGMAPQSRTKSESPLLRLSTRK